jgi:hypothetical protein
MVHIHAVRKLLNTSGIQCRLMVTQKIEGQRMHDWYVTFTGTGFRGRMVMLYFHDPSMMMVATPGKSPNTGFPAFRQRLEGLLQRSGFPADVIQREIALVDGFAAGKTSDRSLLSSINQAVDAIEWWRRRFDRFEEIDYDWIEDMQMSNLHGLGRRKYITVLDYWQETLGCSLVRRIGRQ